MSNDITKIAGYYSDPNGVRIHLTDEQAVQVNGSAFRKKERSEVNQGRVRTRPMLR